MRNLKEMQRSADALRRWPTATELTEAGQFAAAVRRGVSDHLPLPLPRSEEGPAEVIRKYLDLLVILGWVNIVQAEKLTISEIQYWIGRAIKQGRLQPDDAKSLQILDAALRSDLRVTDCLGPTDRDLEIARRLQEAAGAIPDGEA
jgi:hypothetical protein